MPRAIIVVGVLFFVVGCSSNSGRTSESDKDAPRSAASPAEGGSEANPSATAVEGDFNVKMPSHDMSTARAGFEDGPIGESEDVIVHLDRDGRVFMNGELCDRMKLESLMKLAHKEDPKQVVVFRVDERCEFKHVNETVEICTKVGLEQIKFTVRQALD